MDNEKLPAILFSADGSQILHGGGINSGRSYGKTYAMERWKNLQESEPIIIGMDFNQEPSRTIITKLNVEGDVITPEEMPHMENVVKTVTDRYGKGIPKKSWRRKKNLRNIQRRSRKANRS